MFIGIPMVAGSVLQNRICLTVGCFLGTESLVFSKCWRGTRNPYEVACDRARFFINTFFAPKTGKIVQKWVKKEFFEFIKNFVFNFYKICSIMKDKLFAMFLFISYIW